MPTLTEAEEIELLTLLEAEYLDKCRTDFWTFCQLQTPKFYRDNRTHLRTLCDTLQAFVEDKLLGPDGQPVQKLMINMPPRHGKTLTVENLTKWVLGRRPETGVMAVSYSQDLSGRFAKEVRDRIQEIKASPDRIVFSDVFPEVRVKAGDAAYHMWSLEGSHFSFLATSPGATMTGVGAQLGVIDDLIKNAKEAFNDRVLEGHREWYLNTYQSRLEAGAKELLIMTRWATGDLCGWLQQVEPEAWHVITMPAFDEKADSMLAPDILSRAEFFRRKAKTDPVIFEGNYQQKPFDSQDALYPGFKTYRFEDLEPLKGHVAAYVDTADEGADYLAGFVYLVAGGLAYILDCLYTTEPMERTEPKTAKMLIDNEATKAWIESNNGGRGFARNVERLMREAGYTNCAVEWFHQSENKWARILTNATSVVNCVIFPEGWQVRWPQLHRDLMRLSRMTKPEHDDAPDGLTGIVEKSLSKPKFVFL